MNQIIAEQIMQQGGIEAYLQAQQQKGLLRFLTCGNVDDGKSTLIGRLLHDTQQIYVDQLAVLHTENKRIGKAGEKLDLALLVDGLQAEREQGITIDVAYRYFSTTKRKFIIADTPGHEQYTRNMATGASNSEVAIVLIDANKGLQVQTKRHSFITTLLGIRHLIVAINKMDLVDYKVDIFTKIKNDYLDFIRHLPIQPTLYFVPLSALEGDNVVFSSGNMNWYQGETLLDVLEQIPLADDPFNQPLRFPIQYVNRPQANFRGYAGTVAAGRLGVGQRIKVLPSGVTSTIDSIVTFGATQQEAYVGEAVTVVLSDNIDVMRGDLLVSEEDPLIATHYVLVDIVWMSEMPLTIGQRYNIKIAGKKTVARIASIESQVDINTLTEFHTDTLPLNGIGLVRIVFDEAVLLDRYLDNRYTGSFIVIDPLNNATVGAGLVRETLLEYAPKLVNDFERELHSLIRRYFPHWQIGDI